jgi:hypothetical protein
MKKLWVAIFSLAAAVAFATPAAAIVCPAPGSFTPSVAQAADIGATGFNCPAVDLIINKDITPITLQTLKIEAKTITISGPAKIVNTVAGSDIFLTAAGGGISITQGEIRAADLIIIECKVANCPITIQNSIVRAPINPLDAGGDVRAIAHGNVVITGSTFFGGNKVGVFSAAGSVTWICDPGTGACLDPVTSGTALALCGPDPGDPTKPKVPCPITFNTLAQITAFCIEPQNVECGGGSSECQVNAFLDVHMENSTVTCNSHFAIISKSQSIFAANAVLTAKDALFLQAFKGVFAPGADLHSLTGTVTVETKGGITAPNLCIDVQNADITKPRSFQPGAGCTVNSTGLTPP